MDIPRSRPHELGRYPARENMTLSKRNSRPIVVGESKFRWAFSAPYDSNHKQHLLTLTVQNYHGNGAKLIGSGSCQSNNEYLLESSVIMTPAIVAQIINDAIDAGWDPDGNQDWRVNQIERYVND